jgi:hypothetical protein
MGISIRSIMIRIYLDDVRTPIDGDWIVVRNYDEFIQKVDEIRLENIEVISLDHDLGPSAMKEYFNNVSPNYKLDYNNIDEKTGMDCAKWLVQRYYELSDTSHFPQIYTHSANPIGASNIMGYINNFLMNERMAQTCVRVTIKHTYTLP